MPSLDPSNADSRYIVKRPPVPPVVPRAVFRRLSAQVERAARGTPNATLVTGLEGAGHADAAHMADQLLRGRNFSVVHLNGRFNRFAFEVATRMAEILEVQGDFHDTPALMARHLREALRTRFAAGQPVAVVVEEAIALNEEDRWFLLGLALEAPSCGVSLLFTAVDEGRDQDNVLRRDFGWHRNAEVVELGPLPQAEAMAYAESVLPAGAVAPRFVRDLVRFTGGRTEHFAAMLQTIRELPTMKRAEVLVGSRPVEQLAPPARLVSSLTASVKRLGERETPPLLEALAVWGMPTTLATIVQLLDEDVRELEDEAERIDRVSRLFNTDGDGSLGLASPLLGQVLASRIPESQRRRLHSRAADLIESGQAEADEEMLVRHYVEGHVALTPPRIQHIANVARYLAERTRYSAARRLLKVLVDGGESSIDGSPLPHDISALLAETLSRAGDLEGAGSVLRYAADRRSPDAIPAVLRLARDQITMGQSGAALELYRSLLDEATIDPRQRARILLDIARIESAASAGRFGEEALATAIDTRDWDLAAEASLSNASVLMQGARPRTAMEQMRDGLQFARRSGHFRARSRALAALGELISDAESLRRGERWLRRSLRLVEQAEDYGTVSRVSISLSEVLLEQGKWEESEQAVTRAVYINANLHRFRSLTRSRALLRMVRALREPGREETEEHHGLDPFDVITDAHRLRQDGDAAGALALLMQEQDRLMLEPGQERTLLMHVLPWVSAMASGMSDRERVRITARQLQEAVERTEGEHPIGAVELLRAHAEGAVQDGDLQPAIDGFMSAADAFASYGYIWRQTLSLQRAAECAVAAGQTGCALELLSQVHRRYDQMGLRTDLKALRGLFESIGHRPPSTQIRIGTLSPREAEVASQAAEGLTDQQISERLGVSRRTVNTHMANILRKLEIRSRSQIVEALDQRASLVELR